MKNREFVWVIDGDFHPKNVFRFPFQIRKFAKENGFSMYDETCTRFDMIVFCKKDDYGDEKGFYALRREIA